MLDKNTQKAIRQAFLAGKMKVEAIHPETGAVVLCAVADVMQHHVPHKRAFKVTLEGAQEVVATEDHSLFLRMEQGIQETPTGTLRSGDKVAVVVGGDVVGLQILEVEEVLARTYMYDLSVPGVENFILVNGIIAHNSYSIGGISLDLEKSSKYESLKQNAEGQLDKATEAKARTVKFIRGLRQPKFGFGVRSSFGPNTGRGILSPRSFV